MRQSLVCRAAATAKGEITGYAARFDTPDLGGEIIRRGAFLDSITDWKRRGLPMPMLLHHDETQLIGAWHDVQETAQGLAVRGQLILDETGQRVLAQLEAKALAGLSIGFTVERGDIEITRTGRVVKRASLHEISLVSVPASPESRVTSVRAASPSTIRELEECLRDAGYSRSQAAGIAARGFRAVCDAKDPTLAAARAVLAALHKINHKG